MENEKLCPHCQETKQRTEFYASSRWCKKCMNDLSRRRAGYPRRLQDSLVPSERMAIKRLNQEGIPALPGKVLAYSHVDVVCWGCVRIEIKYAGLKQIAGWDAYEFVTTPAQVKRGLLADIAILICDNGIEPTYHLFPANHPVFYRNGKLKTGLIYSLGPNAGTKHSGNRVVMTRELMDSHLNAWELIEAKRIEFSEKLRNGS